MRHLPAQMTSDRYDPIAAALKEDIGDSDVTTDFFVPETLRATGRIIVREKAVVAGTGAAAEVFRQVDPSTDIQISHVMPTRLRPATSSWKCAAWRARFSRRNALR